MHRGGCGVDQFADETLEDQARKFLRVVWLVPEEFLNGRNNNRACSRKNSGSGHVGVFYWLGRFHLYLLNQLLPLLKEPNVLWPLNELLCDLNDYYACRTGSVSVSTVLAVSYVPSCVL